MLHNYISNECESFDSFHSMENSNCRNLREGKVASQQDPNRRHI